MNIWIEYRTDENHGGPGWNFGEALWSPTRKKNNTKNAYWETVKSVKKGDLVFHISSPNHLASFKGYSYVSEDGILTKEKPPEPGKWESENYFKAPLKNFTKFDQPLNLREIYIVKEKELKKYLATDPPKRTLLFSKNLNTIQGAYLSRADFELMKIMLDVDKIDILKDSEISVNTFKTGIRERTIKSRIGQKQFSDNVKNNYFNKCCFPDCDISDKDFLIGSHIERWADNEEKRGNISNGLCFCLLHDKAFENGYFSIDENNKIIINKVLEDTSFSKNHLVNYEGKEIKNRIVDPDKESLKKHQERINFLKRENL